MPLLSAERLLSMSAFEAAQELRSFRKRFPEISFGEMVRIVRVTRADNSGLDYEAGYELERTLPNDINVEESQTFFRSCIDAVIGLTQPFWVRLAPGGREQVISSLSQNGIQCFRAAGLLERPPSQATWKWWDSIAASVREARDAALLEQGRQAEWWSYERESNVLIELGIDSKPEWAAIESNSLGYDILSYRKVNDSVINRLIEVKSSASQPPSLILTRNEWRAAVQYGDSLEFHLWTLPDRKLYVLSFKEVQQHVPIDSGRGEWATVQIRPEVKSC